MNHPPFSEPDGWRSRTTAIGNSCGKQALSQLTGDTVKQGFSDRCREQGLSPSISF